LPLLAEYSDAGYREPKDRILYSLRSNGQYHAMVLGSGALGLVYVIVSYGFHFESLKALVMALAYCWGLVLAIYLMGHGLVAIPRRLIRNGNLSARLRRIQGQAPKAYEKMEDSEVMLEELEMQVFALSRRKGTGSASDFREWIEELLDMTSLPEAVRPGETTASGPENRNLPTVITSKYMADLTRHLIRARHARERYHDEWNRLLQQAIETQAVINSARSRKLEFGKASPKAGFWDRIPIFTPYTRHIYHYYVVPYASVLAGVALAVASVFIVWSEMVKVAFPSLSLIRLSVVHHWTGDKGQVGFAGQVIAALWILYMCAAALISITEVKVWRGRALVKRNTAHESAFWYASQVARLSVPLSYNFMTFLSAKVYNKTIFYDFLGRLIDFTSLGKWFDYLFPIFVLVPVFATLFGLYGRVKRFFGFGDIVDDEDEVNTTGYGTGSWREGRDLIDRELNGTSIRQRRLDGASSTSAAEGRSAPVMTVPGGGRSGRDSDQVTTPFATSPSAGSIAVAGRGGRRAIGASSRSALPTEIEDENFFQALGHRMKNTIDTMDTPKWFQELGQGIKKPKWMGGGGGDENIRPVGPQADLDGFRRWFGGGDSGRIRL
jgi:hypothetical protein